ncbi:MAG: alpha/beta fold hydrolase, partial [Firmicutes bacterium]|nr:alpha/beta fold hydrolase [Bacillota bacterium]
MKKDTVSFDGISMDYCVFGHGPKTLVIVPGVSLCKVTGSYEIIAEQYKLFHEEYTVYVFDRRNDMPAGYSIEEAAEDVVSAMKVLGLGKSSFLATSQGGMIELMIGLEHPELVDRMAVISSTARVNDTMRSSIGRWVEWSKAGNMKALIDDIGEKLYTKNFVDKYYPAEALLKTSQEDMERFIIQCEASPDFDIYDRLGEIKFPVLVAGEIFPSALMRGLPHRLM